MLRAYDLYPALTPEDDPRLWEAVLAHYWGSPAALKWDVAGLRFGAGPRSDSGLGGIEPRDLWCFERVDADHLRSTRCPEEVRSMAPDETIPEFLILDVSRPSANENRAYVHSGFRGQGLIGEGETHVWVRRLDGTWSETAESLTGWMS